MMRPINERPSWHAEADDIRPGARLLRRQEVEHRTGRSRSAMYKEIAAGTFPAPVVLGSHSVAWLEQEIDGWIAEKVAQRNAQARG